MGHLWVSFAQGFGFSGEFHSGSNLVSYFGGINNANTFDGVNTFGAWAWAWLKASPKVTFGAGFGMDNPEDADINAGAITNNTSYFFNVKYSPVKAFTMGIEASQWETEYQDADTYSTFRVQTSFILNF